MNLARITQSAGSIAQRAALLGILTALGSSAQAAESIHDLELGIKAELPIVATPMVIGPPDGDRQLHFGFQGEMAYALNDHLYFTSEFGTRRQFILWPVDGDSPDAFVQTRTFRALAGLERSFTKGPTFPTVSASVGFVSAWWGLEIGALEADRVGRGGSATISGGVDHFLTPRLAVSGELRFWGEAYGANAVQADMGRFENPPLHAGVSALAGFTFR